MQTNPLASLSTDDALSYINEYLLSAPSDVVLRLRKSLDSPRFADCRSVISFIAHYNLRLRPDEAHEFTLLPPGVYTHNTLPYGPTRLGIRRGDVAYIATESHGVVEVHLSNMNFHADSPTPYRGSGKAPADKQSSPKASSRRGQPVKEFVIGDCVKDEFGTRHTVSADNIDRLKQLSKALDFTYNK